MWDIIRIMSILKGLKKDVCGRKNWRKRRRLQASIFQKLLGIFLRTNLKSLVSTLNGITLLLAHGLIVRDNPDGEDIEYPPPQPLDGEIDRMMETDGPDFVVASDSAVPDNEALVESSKHPASEPVGGDGEDIEEIGSEDDDEDEEDDGEISLEEEDLDEEEEIEGDEDEEMQDVDGADEDLTMQSIESNGHTSQAVAQTS